jgi:hypothetical protein
MAVELTKKQEMLLNADADNVLYGGARGGGKSFGVAAAAALELGEYYWAEEARKIELDVSQYRKAEYEDGRVAYYRYLIDYPYYRGVFIRQTLPGLLSITHPECRKIFPALGATFSKDQKMWTFPSGATLEYRPLVTEDDAGFFQGGNYHRMFFEELTQLNPDLVEMAMAGCRSAKPIGGGYHIKAKRIATTNPGNRGHKWVKETWVDKCKPVNDGDPIYLEEFDLTYQPQKPGKVYTHPESGETFLFIPSMVFDNPHLAEHDKAYIRQLMGKNEILRRMWLFGDWSVFGGQFFDCWDNTKHVLDEKEFFGAVHDYELDDKRKQFDWTAYRLYLSNDYGFAEKSAWACGAYAVHQITGDIIKFAEIVRNKMTVLQQAEYTKEYFEKYYGLDATRDFELIIADPKSYWQQRDKAEDDFYTFERVYAEQELFLTKGNNERIPGAEATQEALRIREDGTPKLRILSNCEDTISTIPNLPADKHNLNDVDTTVFDHCYDEQRYFLMMLKTLNPRVKQDERPKYKTDFRKEMREAQNLGTYEGRPNEWKVA